MRFEIAHQSVGRTRLRAQARPVDAYEFAALAEGVAGLAGVEDVDFRPTTGSLVIEHPDLAWDQIESNLLRTGSIELTAGHAPRASAAALAPVRATLKQVDNLLTWVSSGGLDMRTVTFLVMFALALRQIQRGQIMVPAFSFLWYAFEIASRAFAAEDHPPETPAD